MAQRRVRARCAPALHPVGIGPYFYGEGRRCRTQAPAVGADHGSARPESGPRTRSLKPALEPIDKTCDAVPRREPQFMDSNRVRIACRRGGTATLLIATQRLVEGTLYSFTHLGARSPEPLQGPEGGTTR